MGLALGGSSHVLLKRRSRCGRGGQSPVSELTLGHCAALITAHVRESIFEQSGGWSANGDDGDRIYKSARASRSAGVGLLDLKRLMPT